MRRMRWLILLAFLTIGCGSSTAPTSVPVTPAPTPAPVPIPAPTLTIQTIACPDATVGVELGFYREIGCNGFDLPMQPVRRWTKNPNLFIQTSDVDTATLDMIEAMAREMIPRWSDNRLSVGTVERGTGSRQGQDGWISVIWNATLNSCGLTDVGTSGGIMQLFPRGGTNCSCNGYAIRPRTVRHELGHALGYWHTDSPNDLMSGQQVLGCDAQPSARELAAASYQYR